MFVGFDEQSEKKNEKVNEHKSLGDPGVTNQLGKHIGHSSGKVYSRGSSIQFPSISYSQKSCQYLQSKAY